MLRPGSLLSRTIAVLLLILFGLAAYQLVVVPVHAAYQETAREIEQSRELLRRYRALAAQREGLEQQVAELEAAAGNSEAYLEGTSDALAAAALQDQVRRIIERAEGELRSTQILPATPAEGPGGVRRTSLRLQLGIDIAGLETILYELEPGEPFLFVAQITVREQRGQRRRNEPEPETLLDVSLEVYGYWRPVEA